ncbi:MAG: ABC transporter ATP-binding protein [Micromonosporaceae bacterium]
MPSDKPLLRVAGLDKSFSGVTAVDGVSITVPRGELVGVLGPNGAGKSTLFHLIAGHLRSDAGDIELDGQRINALPPHRRARLGIGLVFQTPRLFAGMTVLDNVMAGQFLRGRGGMLTAAFRMPPHYRYERVAAAASRELLARLHLEAYAGTEISGLPFGIQRRVALAQALGVGHELLLLDEPAAGLTGGERHELRQLIGELRASGQSILLIEHDVGFVAAIADTLVVLDRGRVLAQGDVTSVLADPAVKTAYSGVSA